MSIIGWIILIVLLLLVFPLLIIPLIVYRILLVRTDPLKWNRTNGMPEDEEYSHLYEEACRWREQYKEAKKEVTVSSDGLKLCGEYFDFGCRKAVLIIAGRTESCIYSCFFAEPYRKAGCNVLVIDNRAHGLSEGRYSCLGFREYRDIFKWCELLHDTLGNEKVFLHGICIGSCTALFALTSAQCPDYIRGMAGEGMYINFYESLKNHMVEQKRPIYPFIFVIAFWIRLFSHASICSDGPGKRIGNLKKPILFLHSKEDIYSTPELAVKLYDSCHSEKRMEWFETGEHSRIRMRHRKQYDEAVKNFADLVL